ncbi:hypothetical protein Xmau_02310 [Xenorhabdus mauleonii]|uniref:Uncharacterized protein n=1 Tax=Xenorhabdus mauleonii TaxID=351675 RepID=A0A1I3Z1T7_9GAMM|nr:hypothetical protein [Xenorhabdus mauleonii]PHM40122.1 hypothetical protein Xmau_02310 [Xenorhabdus mauleonii]SFK37947.1 hypothetical protein SAMN05421680_1852 [Xenorhabdus mauleonii]
MKTSGKTFLTDALQLVSDAIELHQQGKKAPLSINVLNQIKKELEEMVKAMNPNSYVPSYPRFIIDWPDDSGLIETLLNVSYNYKRIKAN